MTNMTLSDGSPAIPEPFWVRHWFRWKPACYQCSMRSGSEVRFKDRDEWESHWLAQHNPEGISDTGAHSSKHDGQEPSDD